MLTDHSKSNTQANLSEVDLTIMVSCYNEANLITETLNCVAGAAEDASLEYEIIVVDDCSSDNSAEVVARYIREKPRCHIRLHQNEENKGLACSYIDTAFIGKGKYYRLCPGDNSESRESLANIFTHVGAADILVPYFPRENWQGRSQHRHFISSLFTTIINLVSGYSLKYYNGCAIHLRSNIMRWHPSSYGFGFQADIITQLLDRGASYAEVKSHTVERKEEDSTALTMRNLLSVMHTVLEVAIRRLKKYLYGTREPRRLLLDISSEDVRKNKSSYT
jgi:glycosyltransferase involved in cell wall biosynthesis